jgi:ubiquinol-cytochrome c reductase cytochrome c1 subunit
VTEAPAAEEPAAEEPAAEEPAAEADVQTDVTEDLSEPIGDSVEAETVEATEAAAADEAQA